MTFTKCSQVAELTFFGAFFQLLWGAARCRNFRAYGFVLAGYTAAMVSLPALPPIVGISTLAVGVISTVLYIRHANRVENPLLDLSLFKNDVFRISVTGGSLFRLGIGAIPFLLPLMLQLGFGLDPFQSGMITFVSAIGAISMKFGATRCE